MSDSDNRRATGKLILAAAAIGGLLIGGTSIYLYYLSYRAVPTFDQQMQRLEQNMLKWSSQNAQRR